MPKESSDLVLHFLFKKFVKIRPIYGTYRSKTLKWSFTHKQHAWEPPLNHSWKFDLWPLQTGILKINAGFAEKKPEKVEKITRTLFWFFSLFMAYFISKLDLIWRNLICKGHRSNFQLWFRGSSHASYLLVNDRFKLN